MWMERRVSKILCRLPVADGKNRGHRLFGNRVHHSRICRLTKHQPISGLQLKEMKRLCFEF